MLMTFLLIVAERSFHIVCFVPGLESIFIIWKLFAFWSTNLHTSSLLLYYIYIILATRTFFAVAIIFSALSVAICNGSNLDDVLYCTLTL